MYGKITGNSLGVLKVGWGRASGNHQDVANNMSQFNGVSDMVPSCQLCGSVALCGEGSERSNGLNQHLLSGRKLPPTSCPDVTQFISSPYFSDAFQSAAPMLEVQVSPSSFICQLFKRSSLRLQQFLSSTALILTGFSAKSYNNFSSWH